MIVLTVQHLAKSFGTNRVLQDVNMVVKENQRVGLVGVNGSGKSTLLRLLTGELSADEGMIHLQKGLNIGYLAQSWRPQTGTTVFEEAETVFEHIYKLEEKMRMLERRMAACENEDEIKTLGDEYARAMQRFEAENGYACRSLLQGVLQGLGFTQEMQSQEACKLSGGELTRLCLARLLLQKPDILLLDEPTNHLDLAALKWLEDFLGEYSGAVILVSHDRYFLDRVCTDMVELLGGVSEQYNGNYTRYIEQRAERYLTRTRLYEKQQKEIERQEAIIARFRSFNREKSIKAAESRVKKLEKMDRIDKPLEEKQIFFRFNSKLRLGDDALEVKDLSKSFGERSLFSGVNLDMYSGDRIAMIGPNGVGKTTFLECIIGEKKADQGYVAFGANAQIGYYDQKQASLQGEQTVIREVWDAFPRLTQTEVRGALGMFLFSGDEVFEKVSTLSGGEKARVLLTKLMLREDNFLILDEPTNHLDADSREMLEEALSDFEGTILCVSHDRYFINRIATKTAVLQSDGLVVYDGNYDEYLNCLAKNQADDQAGREAGTTRTEQAKQRRKSRAEQERLKALAADVKAAEALVMRTESNVADIERRMGMPEVYADEKKAAELAAVYKEAVKAKDEAYHAWEEAEMALQSYEQE